MSAAPVLPLSLSPHICIIPSPDLVELLASSSLPPLQHLLQSFSPLPQVTTRTTTLTHVSHGAFPLRFSNLNDIEIACKEDEDSRAGRTIDWIGQRVAKRAAEWVMRVESEDYMQTKDAKTPWFQELEQCTEGDRTPSRNEGWNHPVAVILAVSTLAPNPLQAVTELQSRRIDLPQWVDPTRLRHTLIIHPSNSPLNSDEAAALFNATKKQFGLHTHLLPLSLASPEAPIPVASLLPELPPTPMPDASFSKDPPERHHLNLTDPDVAQFARFVREFVTMSLVPWMERCVLDWNETYSSTRRLPSRLFSSTRRLFGGTGASNATPTSPVHSNNSYSNTATSPTSPSFAAPPPQQRRLAEFATFLGDLKLAVSVWEALRKEGRGGSEVLPLLLSPSPALGAHAIYALSILNASVSGPSSQLRALVYAVRWAAGVKNLETVGGERWLDMAAGITEEPPPALLLAHAALISARKGATRRAAMWYVFAAHRLEKCGVKPLTVYFLRKAHELYRVRTPKNLSPSFDDAGYPKQIDDFDAILPSIEYALGRLMYTSGDTEGALRFFLGLLKGSSFRDYHEQSIIETDALYVEDFKVAFEHLKSTVGDNAFPVDLKPPFSFSSAVETRVRLARQGELDVDNVRWEAFEKTWTSFWKSKGKERLEKGGKAVVGERLWIDIMLRNPLDVDVNLANLTVNLETNPTTAADIEIEVIDNIILRSKESRVVPLSIVAHSSISLKITHLTYSFLSLLPVSEPLAVRGPRLHQTAIQRQGVVYGPDVILKVDVEEGGRRLDLSLSRARGNLRHLILGAGECTELVLNIRNTGNGRIDDLWIIHSPTVWFDLEEQVSTPPTTSTRTEVLRSSNTLANTTPLAVPLQKLHGSSALVSGDSLDLRCVFHTEQPGIQEVAMLLIFRETSQPNFFTSRLHHMFDIIPILNVGAFARPSAQSRLSYVINAEAENVSEVSDLRISQVTTASAGWSCSPVDSQIKVSNLPPQQSTRMLFEAERWTEGSGSTETREFVIRQLGGLLEGRHAGLEEPPPLDVLFSHIEESISPCTSSHAKLIDSSRRLFARNLLLDQFYQLAPDSLPHIFPLRNPQALDIIMFWEIPSEQRRGFVTVPGLLLGACHAPLDEIIQQSETAKVRRTMYAETAREKGEILEAIRASEWNAEMNPIVVRVTSKPRIEHDFSLGHCMVPVTFTIRNFSLTNHTRFVLRLQSVDSYQSSEAQHLPPSYTGFLTRRGVLAPQSSSQVKTKMWISRPGIYGLSGWRLETEVGEQLADSWRTRASYSQGPPVGDETIVTVVKQPL
ncbi:hypothetical protein K439DRAFT_1419748 [Ramaria rubella]|nr:hypothetical protein K439DRAFT_1419748 [Ramaria rubella]